MLNENAVRIITEPEADVDATTTDATRRIRKLNTLLDHVAAAGEGYVSALLRFWQVKNGKPS